MDWLLKRQFYPRHAYRFDDMKLKRDRVEYTPAQERGLILSTACPLPAPLDPISSFHKGIINGRPQSARPLVQFREGGRCRAIGLQWRSENLIQHF